MTYRQIIDPVIDRLDEQGVDYMYLKRNKAEEIDLRQVEESLGLTLPETFRRFYARFADGLHLSWSAGQNSGCLDVPTLDELVVGCEIFRQVPATPEKYDFAPRMGLDRAREVARRMCAWVPIEEDGAGNRLCIDCGAEGGPIVYFELSWFSSDDARHGHVLAPDFDAFLLQWSRVCFVSPLWWPQVFGEREVGWDVQEFPEQFRI